MPNGFSSAAGARLLDGARRGRGVLRVGERAEAQEHLARDRRGRRDRVIERVLRADEDRLAVVGREVERVAFRVVEVREHRVGEDSREPDPARLARRLVEIERRVGDEGVVVEEAGALDHAVLRVAKHPRAAPRPRPRRGRARRTRARAPRPAPARARRARARPSASAPAIRPFQLARIFSSRNGLHALLARREASARALARAPPPPPRASSTGPPRPSSIGSGVESTVAPLSSKLPCVRRRRTRPWRRAPPRRRLSHAASISAGVQTKNFPSSPSLSASCVA